MPGRILNSQSNLRVPDAGVGWTICPRHGGAFGHSNASIDGTLTASVGPLTITRQATIALPGIADLYPTATIQWNQGVHNFMTYVTGDIPVGTYSLDRLANFGIGHGAIDGGAGYTYFNPQTGQEFSAVTGLTYNFKNTETDYQNGIDWHLDWGASQFVSKQLFVGAVGYFYNQITADSGAAQFLGANKSRGGWYWSTDWISIPSRR